MPPRQAPTVFQATRFDMNDVSTNNLSKIRAYYKQNGFVIGNTLSSQECKQACLFLWEKVIQEYPHKKKPTLYDQNGHVIDTSNKANINAFWTAITSPLSAKHSRELHATLPPGVEFGRPISNENFQNDFVNGMRENESLCEVAQTILEEEEMWTNLDAGYMRAPGAGNN